MKENNKFIPNSFQIPNSFIDEILSSISGNAVKCYLIIARKTTGWHKSKDNISTSKIKELSGIKRNETVYSAIEELEHLNLVNKIVNKSIGNSYSINYDVVLNFSSTEKPDILKNRSTVVRKNSTTCSTEKPYIQTNNIKTNKNNIEKIYKKEISIYDRINDWVELARNEINPTQDQESIFETFIEYWTGHNSKDHKFLAEKQKSFIFKQRFSTFLKNQKNKTNQPRYDMADESVMPDGWKEYAI